MFFGEVMGPKQVLYSGMSTRLMFKSLYQRFECPLSTTVSKSVADQFTAGHNGIRLELQRANPKARFFNVAPFSCFKREKERLVMGSTLKITNIYIGQRSFKSHVAALLMLEQIIKGRFIDGGEKARHFLQNFLTKLTAELMMDDMKHNESAIQLNEYLEQEMYDTDAVLCDIEEDADFAVNVCGRDRGLSESSNISRVVENEEIAKRVARLVSERQGTEYLLKYQIN